MRKKPEQVETVTPEPTVSSGLRPLTLQWVDPNNGNKPDLEVAHESPFLVEERLLMVHESGWDLGSLRMKAQGMIDRSFTRVVKREVEMPPFDPGCKLCVRVWIEPPS